MKFAVLMMDNKKVEIEADRFAVDVGNGPPVLFFTRSNGTRCAAIAPGMWVSVWAPDAIVPDA